MPVIILRSFMLCLPLAFLMKSLHNPVSPDEMRARRSVERDRLELLYGGIVFRSKAEPMDSIEATHGVVFTPHLHDLKVAAGETSIQHVERFVECSRRSISCQCV